jgi:hypothetical protein
MDGSRVCQAAIVRDALISIARNGKGVKFNRKRRRISPDFAPHKNVGEFRELRAVGHVLRFSGNRNLTDAVNGYTYASALRKGITSRPACIAAATACFGLSVLMSAMETA